MISTLSVAGFVAKRYLPSPLTATPYGLPYRSFSVLVVADSVFPAAAVVPQPGGGRNAAAAAPFFGAGLCWDWYATAPPPAASSTTRAPASTAGERHAGRRRAATAPGQASAPLAECASVNAELSSAESSTMFFVSGPGSLPACPCGTISVGGAPAGTGLAWGVCSPESYGVMPRDARS